MVSQAKHKAFMQVITWKDARDEVLAVNPGFAKIVDQLDPGKKFPLIRAKYPFGANIAHEGKFYLPTPDGNVKPIDSTNIPNEVKTKLQRRNLPVILMLKNDR